MKKSSHVIERFRQATTFLIQTFALQARAQFCLRQKPVWMTGSAIKESSLDFCAANSRACFPGGASGLRNEQRCTTFCRRFAVPEKIRVSKSCNGIITRFRYRCQIMRNTLSETAQAKPPVSAIGVLQPLSGPGRRLLFLFCFSSGRRCIFSGFLIQ